MFRVAVVAFIQAPQVEISAACQASEVFYCRDPLRIGLRHLRAWFTQSKAHLVEQSLALADAQAHGITLLQMFAQHATVPQILRMAKRHGAAPQIPLQSSPLPRIESPRTPRPFFVMQTIESPLLKALHPTLNRTSVFAEQLSHPAATFTVRDQKHAMQPVVIARFFRSSDLLLDRCLHHVGIQNL